MADDSKTEKATPKKRRDERKKGHVLMSQDVVAVATLFASVVMLRITFSSAAKSLGDFMVYCLELARGDLVPWISDNLLLQMIILVVRVAGPLLGATVLTATIATMAQTRMLVATEPLKPKFSKINPLQGFKRLFSLKSVVDALKNILKIIILMVLIYQSLRDMLQVAGRYMYADVIGACTHLFTAIFNMLIRVGVAFLVLAALDYLYQWWDFERQMKMSKEEIKEEYKQTEGDPKVKGRIKQLQRQMSQARMMQKVPESDVIIRNPTHVAVALRYHPGEDEAPVVLAMGVDYLALKIVEIAQSHDITVIENVALARALYAEAELDQTIPPDLYEAVAEVMVYLYKLGRLHTSE